MNRWFRIAVSGVLVTGLILRTDWAQVGEAFASLRLQWWWAAFLLYLVSQLVSAVRWQLLARPLGFKESLARFVSFYFIGMYFNMLLPTSVGGDVLRAWYLDGGSGRRLAAFVSVFADRFSGLLVLLALACAAVVFCPLELPRWVPASVWGTASCALAGLAVAPLLARGKGRGPWTLRLTAAGRAFRRQPRLLLITTALSLVVQAANVAIVWFIGLGLGLKVPPAYYAIMVPMVSLLTLLPISINGIGVREEGMMRFLAFLGVPTGTTLCLSLLWFAVFLAAGGLGGLVYLLGSFPRPEVTTGHEPVCGDPHQGRARQLTTAA
ncbi:MAG: flippase-like domain-containing protein [Gemmataceae bacterium]|nr:flippase-like domain-containing protein [Gemmataceae bacterium]MDW8263822.1 lysylphosphatidylglycerol synthase transmembrane domain-containing protein [Gemmataceae bacterium]